MFTSPTIIWTYRGKTDLMVGTGASFSEKLLVWLATALAFVVFVYFYWVARFPWSWWQYLLAAVVATDIVGGVVANTLNSCKRFYFSPPQQGEATYVRFLKNHLFFTALHLHPFLVGLLFPGGSLFYSVFWYAYVVIGVLLALKSPLYLSRPLAFLLIVLSLFINNYFLMAPVGLEWFAPCLAMKLIYGHGVREEPYRPDKEAAT